MESLWKWLATWRFFCFRKTYRDIPIFSLRKEEIQWSKIKRPDDSRSTTSIPSAPSTSADAHFEQTLENTVTKAVLEAAGPSRRQFLTGIGGAALLGLIGEFFPMSQLKALAADPVGKPEKKDLSIGFIPITCATPIIMAEPMASIRNTASMPK